MKILLTDKKIEDGGSQIVTVNITLRVQRSIVKTFDFPKYGDILIQRVKIAHETVRTSLS